MICSNCNYGNIPLEDVEYQWRSIGASLMKISYYYWLYMNWISNRIYKVIFIISITFLNIHYESGQTLCIKVYSRHNY